MSALTSRLVFDPAESADSANVGSYVRAGTDGDLIGSQTFNSEEWLNTAAVLTDSAGNEVNVTSGSLDVNITAAPGLGVYAEDSAHTTGDDGQSILAVRVDDLTAVPASVLAGTEGDYQQFIGDTDGALFTASRTLDGTGNAIGSTSGALDVYIANAGTIDIDDDLANTAIENTATPVSTTAVNVVTTALSDRKHLFLANLGNKRLFFGKTGVTTANGYPIYPGEKIAARIGAAVAPQIIGDTGASAEDLRVMELS